MGRGDGSARVMLQQVWTAFCGTCWRAVSIGDEAAALRGTQRAGRYNRPGERVLYASGSPAGVAAAMTRYGERPRAVVRLLVKAERLIDLRDAAACGAFGIDPTAARANWIAAMDQGRDPPSWAVSDRARQLGAIGVIEASRHAPAEWHLVLFRWNEAGGARVVVEGPSRE